MVGVAQLVERQIVVLDVAGSSPVAHPSVYGVYLETIVLHLVGVWRSW